MTKSIRRLYTELKPSYYQLHIVPDASAMTFTGTVHIRLKKTGRPSQRLTFHQNGLKITGAAMTKYDKKKGQYELEVVRINNQSSLDEVRLHTSEMIYSGDYEVTMRFQGKISRGMTGLYPCFFNHEGKEHVVLATQFESHHAREAFPCIDEPEAKAAHQLTLTTPGGLQTLSNTPIEKQEKLANSLLVTTFETTPRMSTYLLAFVIGELHSKTTKTQRGTEVSAWTTIAQPLASLNFGLDVAKRSIEFFEEYFGTDYPLSKLDHVALPDFSSGAMENWGLITYRERALLVYPDESSQATREYIATVIAHETSHQWFGNLVTMRWWDELWLNESFANLMEYQAVDALFPEWHIWDEFVAQEGLSALRRDATPGVQTIKTTVHHPDEISTLFDPSIVYAKGGRLLYTLKNFIGDEAFRAGLTQYFKHYAHGNTTGNDLWQALSASSRQDVAAFMNPWLEQAGFPLVSVDQNGRELSVRQSHFLESGETSDGRVWPVPLFSDTKKLPSVFTKAAASYKLESEEPLYINHGFTGHYIVSYVQAAHRKHIMNLVRGSTLAVSDRLMLLSSAAMLSRAGHQPFGDVLRLLAAYQHESAEAVWGVIALIVAETRRFIDHDEGLEPSIKASIRTLIASEYKRLGWDKRAGESSSDAKLRAIILGLGSYAEEPGIVAEAIKRFSAYQSKPDKLDAELRAVAFATAIRQNADGAFAYLLGLYDKTNNGDLKLDATAALTATRQTDDARKLLGRLIDARLVKPQDVLGWLAYLLRNRYTRQVAWDWMVEHWGWFEQTFARDKSFDYLPRYAAAVCNTADWAKRYKEFFEPKADDIALKRNILMGMSEIDTRVKWLERDLESVRAFFGNDA